MDKPAFCKEPELCIIFRDIDDQDNKFQNTADQSTDGSAADAHFRETELTEDQGVVDPNIDDQGNNGNITGNLYRSDSS